MMAGQTDCHSGTYCADHLSMLHPHLPLPTRFGKVHA